MTQASVAEVVGALRPCYLRARRGDKTRILDEFVALTGVPPQGRDPRSPERKETQGRGLPGTSADVHPGREGSAPSGVGGLRTDLLEAS